MASAAAKPQNTSNGTGGRGKRCGAEGGVADRLVVITVSVTEVDGLTGGTDAGLNEPVAPVGSPETVKTISLGLGELKGTGLKLMLKVAD